MVSRGEYLLDTDICVFVLRGVPPAIERRMKAANPGTLYMSVISLGELLLGPEKSVHARQERQNIKVFERIVPALPLPVGASESYANIRADLERRGQMIGSNDLWIAAHALAANLTLVTANDREFKRVRGLKIENWTK